MSYKPSKEELISYLYGEIEKELAEKIEAYLEANPEERKKLHELQETQLLLAEVEDEELSEPLGFIEPKTNEEWLYWRKYVAIAATLALILSFGWLSNFKIIHSDEGTSIGFGTPNFGMSEEQVSALIYEDRMMLLEAVNSDLAIRNDSIEQKFSMLQAQLTNEDELQQIFEREKRQLLQDVNLLTEQLGEDYRGLLREIVVSFSNNLESQRIEDLRSIQAAFDAYEEANLERQLNVEDALFNLSQRIEAVAANLPNNK